MDLKPSDFVVSAFVAATLAAVLLMAHQGLMTPPGAQAWSTNGQCQGVGR